MLNWEKVADAISRVTCNTLYLCYRPGYALTVCDWKTGYGFRDIKTENVFYPIMIAWINLPLDVIREMGGAGGVA